MSKKVKPVEPETVVSLPVPEPPATPESVVSVGWPFPSELKQQRIALVDPKGNKGRIELGFDDKGNPYVELTDSTGRLIRVCFGDVLRIAGVVGFTGG